MVPVEVSEPEVLPSTRAGDAEVRDVDEVGAGRSPSEPDDQHVAGLDVAVHQPGRVRGVQRRGDLRDDVHDPPRRAAGRRRGEVRQVGPSTSRMSM